MADPAVQTDPPKTTPVRGPRPQGLALAILAFLIVSLIGTGVSVASFFVPGAVVSGLFVALFYGLLVGVKLWDRRAWRHTAQSGSPASPQRGAPPEEPEEDQLEIAPEISKEVVVAERAGFRIGLAIGAPLAALALLLAAVFVGWRVIGLGALAFFAIMLFMGAPIWLAAVEEEIDDAEEKIGVETRSIR